MSDKWIQGQRQIFLWIQANFFSVENGFMTEESGSMFWCLQKRVIIMAEGGS